MTTAIETPAALAGAPEAATAAGTTTILLVRHAEVHNPDRVFYGRLPEYRLSEYGERQAERIAAFLTGRPVAALYCSPLLRARQTADRIAAHHPEAERFTTDLLQEIGTGWQGTRYADFKPGFTVYDHPRGPEDESVADIAARMLDFVALVRLAYPGRTVVGISHGDPIAILRLALDDGALTTAGLRGVATSALGSIIELAFDPGAERPRITTPQIPWTA